MIRLSLALPSRKSMGWVKGELIPHPSTTRQPSTAQRIGKPPVLSSKAQRGRTLLDQFMHGARPGDHHPIEQILL